MGKKGVLKGRVVPISEEIVTIKDWEKNPKRIQKRVSDAAKRLVTLTGKLNYLKIHCHTFRHFFATETYTKKGDLMLVKELSGHEDAKETQIYVHIVRMSNPKKEQ